MEITITAKHWLIFGMILLMAELFIPSFTIFWFGLGAVVVALIMWIMPGTSLSMQLFIWAIASCVFTFIWFKMVRPMMKDRTKAGISKEAVIGESGQVIKTPEKGGRGIVRFTTPVLGSDEWRFICETQVVSGDRVFVKEISGNTLIVEKRN